MSLNINFNINTTSDGKGTISSTFSSMKDILTNISTKISEIESVWTSTAQSSVTTAFKSDLEDIETLKSNFDEHLKYLEHAISLYETANTN